MKKTKVVASTRSRNATHNIVASVTNGDVQTAHNNDVSVIKCVKCTMTSLKHTFHHSWFVIYSVGSCTYNRHTNSNVRRPNSIQVQLTSDV